MDDRANANDKVLPKFQFRISRSFLELKSFIEKLAGVVEVVAVYEHPADSNVSRTHIHGYVEGNGTTTETFKNWIKTALSVSKFDRSDWMFSPKARVKSKDDNEPVSKKSLTYFHKKKYPILFNKGITEKEIELYHGESYVPGQHKEKTKVQFKLISESTESRRKREKDLLDDMITEYKILKSARAVIDDKEVLEIVNKVIDRNNLVCGMYKRMDYYDSITSMTGRSSLMSDMCAILQRRRN